MSERTHLARRPVLAGLSVLALLLALVPSASAAAISDNWAGYVATPRGGARAGFSSVSGSWTQPAATCSAGHASYSAVWVGLGGYAPAARSLEQLGTDADCTRSGRAYYAAWYELLPAAPIQVRIAVHPGDQIVAAVTISGRHATLGIRDLSTGARFARTVSVSTLDVSSADWIVEAPSACASASSCQTLPLTDFGSATFTHATATARGRTGTIADSAWAASTLELRQGSLEPTAAGASSAAPATVAAVPSAVSSATGAFTVTWQERQQQAPAAPSFPGG